MTSSREGEAELRTILFPGADRSDESTRPQMNWLVEKVLLWHRKFSAPEVSKEDIEKLVKDWMTKGCHVPANTLSDALLVLLAPNAASYWCADLEWNQEVGRFYIKDEKWADGNLLQNPVGKEWKFCPICGKERPA